MQSIFYACVSTAHAFLYRGSFLLFVSVSIVHFLHYFYYYFIFCSRSVQGGLLASFSLSELELILPEPASSSSDSVDTSTAASSRAL